MKHLCFSLGALCCAAALSGQYFNDFEGFPILAAGSWSVQQPEGTYVGSGVYVNFGNTHSGLRKVGFNAAGDMLYLPPVDNPASVGFYARTSSGSDAWITIQYHNGFIWVTARSFRINGPTYRYYGADIYHEGLLVPLRVWMTSYGNSVYLDDLSVDNFIPMPVELADFSAALTDEGKVELHWHTLTEINNDYFEVRRGDDGSVFSIIGVVEGAGHSTQPRMYRFVDSDPLPGTSYYQLRQVDYDETESFSPILAVTNFAGRQLEIKLFPTVVDNMLWLRLPFGQSLGEAIILDWNGREWHREELPAGEMEYRFDASVLPTGAYLMRVRWGGEIATARFFKR
jgi:hypothetical protein